MSQTVESLKASTTFLNLYHVVDVVVGVVVVGKRRVKICKAIRTRWRFLFVLSINTRSLDC